MPGWTWHPRLPFPRSPPCWLTQHPKNLLGWRPRRQGWDPCRDPRAPSPITGVCPICPDLSLTMWGQPVWAPWGQEQTCSYRGLGFRRTSHTPVPT